MRSAFLAAGLALTIAATLVPTRTHAANHTVQVGVGGFTYTPQTLVIAANDTVTFQNVAGFHNVASDPGAITSFRCANGCDGAGGNGNASSTLWSATVAFPDAGTIGYFCEIHGGPGSGMFGTIIVNPVPVTLQSFNVD